MSIVWVGFGVLQCCKPGFANRPEFTSTFWFGGLAIHQVVTVSSVIWGTLIPGRSLHEILRGLQRCLAHVSPSAETPKPKPEQRDSICGRSDSELGCLTSATHLRTSLQCLYLLPCLRRALRDNHTRPSIELKRHPTHSFFYA